MSVCFLPLCCNSTLRGTHCILTDVRIKAIFAAAADFVSLHINSLNKQKNRTNLSFVKFSTGVQHHNTNSDCFLEKNSEKRSKFEKTHKQLQATLVYCPGTFLGFLCSRRKKKEYAFLFHVRISLVFSPLFLIKRIDEKEQHLHPPMYGLWVFCNKDKIIIIIKITCFPRI